MGTSASLHGEEQPTKKASFVPAHNVRERLRDEYGGEELGPSNNEASTNLRIDKVPGVLKAKGVFMKKLRSKRRSNVKDTNIVKKQDNHALLKEMFHRIDPSSLDNTSTKVVGEIEIALKYKSSESTLLVKIGRAKNLESLDAHNLPNSFVEANLIIKRADSSMQTQITRSKANTSNPLFQEILIFNLAQCDLVDARLRIIVWNKDSISNDDFLGEVVLQLYREEVNGGVSSWHRLKPQVDLNISGQIQLTLEYSGSTLLVHVHQAKNLKEANDGSGKSHPYVRCYVTGISERAETKVIEDDLNPVFEEGFEFEVMPENIETGVLVLNVRSKEATGKDKRLGDVHILLGSLNFLRPMTDWHDLADLRNTPYARSKWSEEGLSQEFKEAMRAHAIYKYPHCLFQGKHVGRKLVSVSCNKAKCSAKMVIVNGFPVKE
eukprot:gene6892-7670_t